MRNVVRGVPGSLVPLRVQATVGAGMGEDEAVLSDDVDGTLRKTGPGSWSMYAGQYHPTRANDALQLRQPAILARFIQVGKYRDRPHQVKTSLRVLQWG